MDQPLEDKEMEDILRAIAVSEGHAFVDPDSDEHEFQLSLLRAQQESLRDHGMKHDDEKSLFLENGSDAQTQEYRARDRPGPSTADVTQHSSQIRFPESELAYGDSGKVPIESWKTFDTDWTNHMLKRTAASGLCTACTKIELVDQKIITHHQPRNMQLSAQRGCPMCSFLLKHAVINDWSRSADIKISMTQCTLEYKVPSAGTTSFELFMKGERLKPPLNAIYREITDPLSPQSIQLIHKWIRSCQTGHSKCTYSGNFSMPTRLIDVTKLKIRLCSGPFSNQRYATLTHCWGDTVKHFKTTRENISQFKNGIEARQLSIVFQDAISTTRQLGIPYLWIDALCILQDSKVDWLSESPKMGEYYRNAYLTISALQSPDSDHSFLYKRRTTGEIQLHDSGIWMRLKPPKWNEVFRTAALNRRGWCLQERLLSTRIVHFTDHEMLWECQTCTARESVTREEHQLADWTSLTSTEVADFKRALFAMDDNDWAPNGAYDVWMRLIRQYTLRGLTYVTDRLSAVSSLASLLAKKTGSPYISGLWASDLHGLAWFRDIPESRFVSDAKGWTDEKATAPTWSWTHTRESITYRYNDEVRVKSDKDAFLVNYDVTLRGTDPFGPIKSGQITINALTQPVQCIDSSEELQQAQQFVDIYLDHNGRSGSHVGTGCFDQDVVLNNLRYRCTAVRVAERTYMSKRAGDCRIIYFILVQPDHEQDGLWRRVGVGMTRDLRSFKFYGDFFDSSATRQDLLLG